VQDFVFNAGLYLLVLKIGAIRGAFHDANYPIQ
jgi:hypothetical protein